MESNEIKILLTINLEGGTSARQKVTKEYVIRKKDLTTTPLDKEEGHKIVKKGKYTYDEVVTKDAILKVNLNYAAYQYMTSDSVPAKMLPSDMMVDRKKFAYLTSQATKVWKHMKAKERLEWHMKDLCEHYRGKSYNYQVLSD